jgi:hypothetical protein
MISALLLSSLIKKKIHVNCCSKEWTDSLERTQYYSLRAEHVELKTGSVQALRGLLSIPTVLIYLMIRTFAYVSKVRSRVKYTIGRRF